MQPKGLTLYVYKRTIFQVLFYLYSFDRRFDLFNYAVITDPPPVSKVNAQISKAI